MTLRPSSSHERGMFVSVDGPSGAGKSTIVRHLAQMLVADGEDVHVTAEPSNGPIGVLCRELTEIDPAFLWQLNAEADRITASNSYRTAATLRSTSTGKPPTA